MNLTVSHIESFLITFSLLLFFSVVASKLSTKFGVPSLIVFLMIGIGASQLGIAHMNPEGAKFIGVLTLILILFLGGLETDLQHIKPILYSGLFVSTFGSLLTALLVAFFLKWLTASTLQLNMAEGLLVGSIVASTDAAAVFSILRSHQLRLKNHLGPLLEMESGSNDVMVYFLMTVAMRFIKESNFTFLQALPMFFSEMIIGTLGGIILGFGMLWVVNNISLRYSGLYPTFTLSMLFFSYSLVNMMHGSGFLAVYIVGIMMGRQDFMHKRSFMKFCKGLEWLLQIAMFVALGLLVTPKSLGAVLSIGLILSLFLMIIARPISVFLGLSLSKYDFKHKAFISWVGLRGAVPIVFGTYLYSLPDVMKADSMFHLIFFVVIVSIVIQGTTLYPLAKWLNLEDKRILAQKDKQILELSDDVKKMLIQLELPVASPANNTKLVDLGMPKNTLIVLIHRDNRYFTPHGNTPIQASDKLFVMINSKKELKEVKKCLHIPI
ncbi:MAG: potassium/proton antiporter [Bacteroidota bacterium]